MKRKTLKKAISAFLSLLMCMMTLLSISTPVFAATTVDAYMVDFPRDGDSNYSATAWGHSATSLMGGWRFLNSKYTTVHSIGTYNGQVSYCIEPGIGQNAGDTLSHKDETFWENYPSHLNPTISPDTIKVLLGRIMQYGYQGNVSTSWRSQNASDAAALSHIIATQLLVWETVVGERDASFNKVDPSGYGKSAVWSYIRDEHPLRSQIRSYYNSMAASVQSHAEIPSFCARSVGSARSYELKYDGTRYTVTLTDTNGVLSNFSFSSSEPGISFSRSGNRLTITSDMPIAGDIRVSASKTNGVRSGVVVADVAVEGRQLLHSRLYLIEYTCVHGGRKAVALIAQAHALEIEIGLYILWCSRHLVLLVAFALHCVPLQRRCVYHSPEALRIRHGMGAKSVHHLKVGAVHAAAVAVARWRYLKVHAQALPHTAAVPAEAQPHVIPVGQLVL